MDRWTEEKEEMLKKAIKDFLEREGRIPTDFEEAILFDQVNEFVKQRDKGEK